MSEPLLEVFGLSRSFGGIAATSDVSLKIARGEIHAVIGPNGAGKTTLVALLAGELAADSGTIRFREDDITLDATPARARRGLARTFQVTSIFSEFSIIDFPFTFMSLIFAVSIIFSEILINSLLTNIS